MTRREADPARIAAYRRGLASETLAAWSYRLRLFRVIGRRYRTPAGEIDLILRRGRTIVFAEVKRRSTETVAVEAVTFRARKRIARAAELWLAAHPDAANCDLRFDLVLIAPGRLPKHVANAFDALGRP